MQETKRAMIGAGALVTLAAAMLASGAQAQAPKAEADPNDPRPLILQDVNALFVMLGMGEMTAENFRDDLVTYNIKYPAPPKAELAKAIGDAEAKRANPMPNCMAKGKAKLTVRSSTAAPVIRQYIAAGEVVNAWIVKYTHRGCKAADQRVYTALQKPDGELIFMRMGTGDSHINLNVHYDLSRILRDNLPKFYSIKKADCSSGKVSAPAMRIISKSDDWGDAFYGTRLSGQWREEWTFQGCGGTAVIPIDMVWTGQTNTEYLVQFPEATWTPDS